MTTFTFVDPEVEKSWLALRNKASRFIQAVENLSDAERSLAPPKGFNSVETLNHLRLTDKFELGLIVKTGGPIASKPKVNFIGRMAMWGMSRPRPIPAMPELTPSGKSVDLTAAQEAGREWTEVLNEVSKHAAACRSDQTVLKHPLFGRFGPLELAQLMEVHLNYHVMRLQAVLPELKI